MATVEFFLRGDQIGTWDGVTTSGKGNGIKVTLLGVEPLGDAETWFRVVVSDVPEGDTDLGAGQLVTIHAWPEPEPDAPALYGGLSGDPMAFDGRASGNTHHIFTGTLQLVIDAEGLTAGPMQYGPGINPVRYGGLDFGQFPSTPPITCFVKGTLIETDTGPLPIEVLRPGDLVRTADNGLCPVRHVARSTVPALGDAAPIAFAPGAIGNYRWLHVSPQHRILLRDWRADLWFGAAEVLVAARHLVNDTTIRPLPRPKVTYLHLVLDRHEVIYAEGIATESLHLGEVALSALGPTARVTLERMFPQAGRMLTARRCLTGTEAAVLTGRRVQPRNTGVLSPAA